MLCIVTGSHVIQQAATVTTSVLQDNNSLVSDRIAPWGRALLSPKLLSPSSHCVVTTLQAPGVSLPSGTPVLWRGVPILYPPEYSYHPPGCATIYYY